MPQSSKHVEQLAPELERIVSPSEPIQDLADGFGTGSCLTLSDISVQTVQNVLGNSSRNVGNLTS